MDADSDDDDFDIKRFERPSLIRQIKNILQQYPDDSQIFKEIIQNAEDAGASCVKFIYNKNDYRQSSGKKYSVDGLQQYQGPALLAYNDAKFTNSDWKGIISLGISCKEKDPLKVGRFGLGFKSVFHLTDMPIILSGCRFAYIDPMARLFYDEEDQFYREVKVINLKSKKGFGNLSDLDYYKHLPGVFRYDAALRYQGTLFRFPFRDSATQSTNPLSNNCFNSEKINGLISAFKKEAARMLIFLKHVNKISFEVLDGTEILDSYTAKVLDGSLKKYKQNRETFLANIKSEIEKKTFSPHLLAYELIISEFSEFQTREYHYSLSEVFGCQYDNEFMGMIKDSDLAYLPLIGVAYQLDKPNSGGHIYCGLPLPFSQESLTGLPVHINGYFALGSDRKDLKWKSISNEKSHDRSVLWNIMLLKRLAPVAYLNLIKFLIALNLKSCQVYNAWPSSYSVNPKWKIFLASLYSQLMTEKCIFSHSMETWEIPKKVQFLKSASFKDEAEFKVIYLYLESIKHNFAVVPENVFDGIQKPHVMDRSIIQSLVAQNVNFYSSLNQEHQNVLLSYIIRDYEDAQKFLGELPLRMVEDSLVRLTTYSEDQIYLLVKPYTKKFLPNKEKVVDTAFYSEKNIQVLQEIARKETTNIILLDTFAKVIAAIRKTMPLSWKTCDVLYSISHRSWVDLIWHHSSGSSLSTIENLPLVPVQKGSHLFYRRLQRYPKVMLSTYQEKSKITDSIKYRLVDNGVEFAAEELFCSVPLNNQQFLQEYILLPTENGILNGLRCQRYPYVSLSNTFCADFKKIIEDSNINIPSYVYDMSIFVDVRARKVSIRDSYISEEKDVPPGFTQSSCNISLVLTSTVNQRLQEKLSFHRIAFDDLMKQYLTCHKTLSIADSKFFVEKVSSMKNISNDIILRLKSKVQIKTGSGCVKPVDSLFERTTKTEAFFYREHDSFPDESYNISALQMFGLKSELHIAEPDIIARISYVNKNYELMDNEGFGRKVKEILSICLEKNIPFSHSVKWIPIQKALPNKYPTSLPWKARTTNLVIECFQNTYPWHYFEIVGSASYIVSHSLSAIFSKFDWQCPSLNDVLFHLQNIEQSYNDDERGLYKGILTAVYKYLGETFHPDEVAVKWKKLNLKLWQGNQFIEPGRITLLQDCFNLSPYMYFPEGNLPDSFTSILEHICDSNKSKLELYIYVLSEIKQHYDKVNDYSEKDLGLAIQMLRFIAYKYDQLNIIQKKSIYVPVEHKFLKFFNSKECFYHDNADCLSRLEIQHHKITHGCIDKSIIKMLEIPDLVSEILNDDENDLFEDWGQGEPLTLRLNRLLKDYEDGLPIFKELIQNADDAKATEIFFLYDERSNDHLKSSLIDQSMKQWQGPAMWVYNDAVFTEDDFENIRRSNAGMKETDTTKIGKFGLGFNAVYHLTDVPCFLSGNYAVYFDPHSRYLGRALRSKNECGKRIDLRKNKALIPFNDQFKIFDGIFKARIDFVERNFETYNHTLFRLPLRNRETASISDICNLNYTSHEMKLLLDKLKESLETLILFTENINKVSVYHLEENATSSKMTPMFSVKKRTNTQSSNLINESLLVAATKQMEEKMIPQQSSVNSLTSTRLMYIDMLICLNEHCSTESVKETWLQLAFTGSQKNISFAKVNKGLAPCGGVAINYRQLDEKFEILKDKNKIFCFLPLPKESNLPVSVNGAFLITNDRKRLAAKSSEVKCNAEDWNLMLAKDIGSAYFDLLLYLKSTFSPWKVEDWFSLFPTIHEINHNAFNNAILTTLVNTLIRSDKQLFPVENKNGHVMKWVDWKDILCPPKALPLLKYDINMFVNHFLQQYKKPEVCMNLPENIKHLVTFYISDKLLDNLYIKEEAFFNLFFKFIHNVPKELADNIMLAILSQQPKKGSKLRNYLENTQCIPTLPSGNLKRPQDLVKTSSTVAQLYDIKDEVFPCEEYISKHGLFLQMLGMSTDYLEWEKIISKAREIAGNNKEQDINLLVNRSRVLLKLMSSSISKCTENQKSEITQISFLPVKSTPKSSNRIPWYGQGKVFCSGKEAYTSRFVNIISSSAPVLDCEIDDALAKFLGVDRIPTFQKAIAQVDEIELRYKRLTNEKESYEICEILRSIFTFLFDNYREESSYQLVSKSIIYDNDRKYLANPTEIFFDSRDNLVKVPGYIYKVASDLTYDWKIKLFLQFIGVKESPAISDLVMVLQIIKSDYKTQPVPRPILNAILNSVIPKIVQGLNFVKIDDDIYVPDDTGTMQKSTDLCYKDVNWIGNTENFSFAHPEIPYVRCMRLGIEILRKKHFLEHSIGFSFGQHEDLTKRIKNVLCGYTEKDVIKELLQNSDDSNATEVEFILDQRNHEAKKIFSDKWKKLQGPALIVTNNGSFTENDLDAIQKLGEGNKSKDRSKTGRYGVGFNAVYNITDCPSLHVRLKEEAYLCIFDPNLHYISWGTAEKPGRRIDSAVIKEVYEDIYEAHLLNGNNVPNTLFRLPLRTKEMAETSQISNKETTVQDIKRYFSEIYQYIGEMLLFLVNIRKIKFSILKVENKELTKTSEEFSVFTYDFTQSDFDRKSKAILEYDRNPFSSTVATVSYKTCVQHVSDCINCCEKHYFLVEQIGFSEIKATQCVKCDVSGEFFTFPKGAVACTIRGVRCRNCCSIRGKLSTCKLKGATYGQIAVQNVFCTLPISTNSDLPVLVNGNFLLEYETRRALWVGMCNAERKWNYKILSQCVLPCYITLLHQVKENTLKNVLMVATKDPKKQQQEIYNIFPKFVGERKLNYWDYLSSLFYQEIFARNEKVLPVACNKSLFFSRPRDQFIVYVDEIIHLGHQHLYQLPIESSQKPVLLEILQNVGLHIDFIPSKIARNFEQSGNPLTYMSPPVIREKLKNVSQNIIFQNFLHIQQSCFKDASSLVTVLEYCMKDINEGLKRLGKEKLDFIKGEVELTGLPLCLLADDTVRIFSKSNPVFVTRFSGIFQRNQSMFVHKQLVNRLEKYKFSNVLRTFKLQDFLDMLQNELSTEKFKGNFIMRFNVQNEIKKVWLKNVWEFLKSFKKDLQEHLKEWSLLLANLNSEEYLLPVSQSTSVLFLEAEEDKCDRVIGVLRELPVYEVTKRDFVDSNYVRRNLKDEAIYPREFQKDFFGSINRIKDLESALLLSQYNYKWKLSTEQAKAILDHLENLWLYKHCYSTKIHNLPIFIKYDGSLTKIDREAVVLPEPDIPFDGLDIIEEHMKIKFIKAGYPRIFKKVGCQAVTLIEFYTGYIFPHLFLLPVPTIMKQMSYIKFTFFQPFSFLNRKVDVKNFIERLSSLKFIPVQEGVFKAPSELYDPRVRLFELVFENEHFPPSYFRKKSWLNWLRSIGLITELSKQLAIQIANLIQDFEGKNFVEASQMLCENIKMKEFFSDDNFLYGIRSIKFLIPKQIREINEKIYRSLNKSTSRMCYDGSVHYSQENLVWTSNLILPNYACFFDNQDTYVKLGVKQGLKGEKLQRSDYPKILFQDALQHIDNLTNNTNYKARTRTCKTIPEVYREQYKCVLKEFYKFLQLSQPLERTHIKLLNQRSMMLVNDNADLDIPGRSNLSKEMKLPPYINEVSIIWGEYFEFFKEIGCQESSTTDQFFDVLIEIKSIVIDKHLSPNEITIVSQAVTNVSSLLKKSPLQTNLKKKIYLPCIKRFHPKPLEPVYLLPSSELIYINDYHMQERMKDFEGNFMLSKYEGVEDAMNINEILLSGLPAGNMPQLLSDLVQEVLNEPISEVEAPMDHFSKKLSLTFSSPYFYHGLERLIKYEYKVHNKSLPELENIFKVIQTAKISVLKTVQTNLICNKKVISASETDKEVYTKATKNSFEIYLQVDELTNASAIISQGILDLLELYSIRFDHGKNNIVLLKLLEIPAKEIPELLDNFGISRETSDKEVRYLPTPGDLVPQTLYPYLRNSFERFEVGEFVAISREFEGAECYVFGIIRGCESNESVHVSLLVYDVQVDEDPTNLVKFKDFDLYGFDRLLQSADLIKEIVTSESKGKGEQTEMPMPQNDEEAVKEIRDILRFLSELDEESKKKVIRKLYLKWHPDKYEEHKKAFATRIFQFLLNELTSDHKNLENNFDSWNSSASTYNYFTRSNSGFFYDGSNSSPNFHHGSNSSQDFHHGSNSSQDFHHGSNSSQDFHHDSNSSQNFHHGSNSSPNFRNDSNSSQDFHHGNNSSPNFHNRSDSSQNSHHASNSSSNFSFFFKEKEKANNPQPAQSKRWYRQAEKDLQAAKDRKEADSFFQWHCFMAKQAAEKALKAARYLKHYEMIKGHDLRVVAIPLEDAELTILAASLESLIISSPHLLYPNNWPMPTIPYEQYDETASNKAIDLATKILAIVYRKIYD